MAAHEHLGEQFLFHGTNRKFRVGESLLPPSRTGVLSKWPASDQDKVYMSTKPEEAARYGSRVYRVQPHGEVDTDFYFPEHGRTAVRGTIVGEH